MVSFHLCTFLLTQRCSRATARACAGEVECSHNLKRHCSAHLHVVDYELVQKKLIKVDTKAFHLIKE